MALEVGGDIALGEEEGAFGPEAAGGEEAGEGAAGEEAGGAAEGDGFRPGAVAGHDTEAEAPVEEGTKGEGPPGEEGEAEVRLEGKLLGRGLDPETVAEAAEGVREGALCGGVADVLDYGNAVDNVVPRVEGGGEAVKEIGGDEADGDARDCERLPREVAHLPGKVHDVDARDGAGREEARPRFPVGARAADVEERRAAEPRRRKRVREHPHAAFAAAARGGGGAAVDPVGGVHGPGGYGTGTSERMRATTLSEVTSSASAS